MSTGAIFPINFSLNRGVRTIITMNHDTHGNSSPHASQIRIYASSIRMIFALSLIVCMEIYRTWMAHTISGKFRWIRWNPWAKCVSSNNKLQFNCGCSIHTHTHIHAQSTYCPAHNARPVRLYSSGKIDAARMQCTRISLARMAAEQWIWLCETRAIFPLPLQLAFRKCHCDTNNNIATLSERDREEIVDACLWIVANNNDAPV